MKDEKVETKDLKCLVDKKVDEGAESTSLEAPSVRHNDDGANSTRRNHVPTTSTATRPPMAPLPPRPGAVRVGSDDSEEISGAFTMTSTSVYTEEQPSSSLPIAAELSSDADEERRALKEQLQRLQETTVEAVVVDVDEKSGSSNLSRKLKASTSDGSLFSTRKPENAVDGVVSGTSSLFKGVFAGVASVLNDPIAGAQEKGIEGFGKGCVTGVSKCVALPIAGLAVGCYQVGRGSAKSLSAVSGKGKRGATQEEDVNETREVRVVADDKGQEAIQVDRPVIGEVSPVLDVKEDEDIELEA